MNRHFYAAQKYVSEDSTVHVSSCSAHPFHVIRLGFAVLRKKNIVSSILLFLLRWFVGVFIDHGNSD
jgi:hypothetical protein